MRARSRICKKLHEAAETDSAGDKLSAVSPYSFGERYKASSSKTKFSSVMLLLAPALFLILHIYPSSVQLAVRDSQR